MSIESPPWIELGAAVSSGSTLGFLGRGEAGMMPLSAVASPLVPGSSVKLGRFSIGLDIMELRIPNQKLFI